MLSEACPGPKLHIIEKPTYNPSYAEESLPATRFLACRHYLSCAGWLYSMTAWRWHERSEDV